MRNVFGAVLLACGTCASGVAQDVDPFFAGRAQMVLDPSRTGFDPGAHIAMLHNDQWLSLPDNYRTELLTAEWCARNTKRTTASWLGLGFGLQHERPGAVGSQVTSAGISPAMHLRAGRRSYLSAGIEARWGFSTIGDDPGRWGDQYDGLRYDSGLPSGERFASGTASWVEARLGLSITVKQDAESPRRRERNVLVAGLAADHLGRLRLRESAAFQNGAAIRCTAYAMGEVPYAPWDDGFFSAELIGHVQGPFRTARVNVYAGKHLFNRVRSEGGPIPIGFKAGLGYRLQDALLVNAAIDLNKLSLGMAYGWSVFNKDGLAAGRRTFELVVQLRTV